MGKRSSQGMSVIELASAHRTMAATARAEIPPAEPEREQSWRRKIRPQSEGQRRLMAAIGQHNLTMALGPAGTGKTYLAVSAAVGGAGRRRGRPHRLDPPGGRGRRAGSAICRATSAPSSPPICARSTTR